jgi:hypothetical protein
VIHAEGEFQASQRLRDAAEVIAPNPAALQLRYLQTLTEIGAHHNSTIVFPLPLDIVRPFLGGSRAPADAAIGEDPAGKAGGPPTVGRGSDGDGLLDPPRRSTEETELGAGRRAS